MLLGWLSTNEASAAEKYEKIRARLIRLFVGRGCYEAEMLADQTIGGRGDAMSGHFFSTHWVTTRSVGIV